MFKNLTMLFVLFNLSTCSDSDKSESDDSATVGTLAVEIVESSEEVEANLLTDQYKSLPSDLSFEVTSALTLQVEFQLQEFDGEAEVETCFSPLENSPPDFSGVGNIEDPYDNTVELESAINTMVWLPRTMVDVFKCLVI